MLIKTEFIVCDESKIFKVVESAAFLLTRFLVIFLTKKVIEISLFGQKSYI